MSELRCLVLLPESKSDGLLRDMLWGSLHRSGIKPIRIDSSIPYGAPVTHVSDTARQMIESADMIIADLTETNPNIMYEVGYAHALRKPVLPILESGEQQVPSDLSGYLYYVYVPGELQDLERVVRNWAERTAAQSFKL